MGLTRSRHRTLSPPKVLYWLQHIGYIWKGHLTSLGLSSHHYTRRESESMSSGSIITKIMCTVIIASLLAASYVPSIQEGNANVSSNTYVSTHTEFAV